MSQTPNLSTNYASIPNPPGISPTDRPGNNLAAVQANSAIGSAYASKYGGGMGGQNHPQVGTPSVSTTTVPGQGGTKDTPVSGSVTAPTNAQPSSWWTS